MWNALEVALEETSRIEMSFATQKTHCFPARSGSSLSASPALLPVALLCRFLLLNMFSLCQISDLFERAFKHFCPMSVRTPVSAVLFIKA